MTVKDLSGSGPNRLEAWLNPGEHGERLDAFEGPSHKIIAVAQRLARMVARENQATTAASVAAVRSAVALQCLGPLTLKQVVAATGIDKAQGSRTLAHMLREGYVTFEGPNGQAGRLTARTKAVLTPAGVVLHDRAVRVAREHHSLVLAALSPEERRSLHDILEKLSGLIDGWEEAEAD